MFRWLTFQLLPLFLFMTTAQAAKTLEKDSKYVPKKVEKAKKKVDGWTGTLDVGATVNLSQNSNVVGATEGYSFGLGAQLKGSMDYFHGNHEWRTSLKVGEAFTRTSQLDEFVKTNDELALRSTYLYLFESVPWLGPYAELRMNTAIFEGRDVRAEPTQYDIKRLDGTIDSRPGLTKLRLSDPFAPLTLRETLGAFGRPVARDAFTLELKVGFGALQTFAEDQLAIDDDKDTKTVIEVAQLDNIYQAGPAFGVGIRGALGGGRVAYYGLFESMIPVINSKLDSDERSAIDLTNLLFEAGISIKVFDWAKLVYQFKAVREPQLVDKFQIQNNLLLSFSYTLINSAAADAK